jgi:hypothetical protein
MLSPRSIELARMKNLASVVKDDPDTDEHGIDLDLMVLECIEQDFRRLTHELDVTEQARRGAEAHQQSASVSG